MTLVAESEVGFQDSHGGVSSEGVVFCLDSFFVERLVVFGPSEIMLVGADSHKVFNSVLL